MKKSLFIATLSVLYATATMPAAPKKSSFGQTIRVLNQTGHAIKVSISSGNISDCWTYPNQVINQGEGLTLSWGDNRTMLVFTTKEDADSKLNTVGKWQRACKVTIPENDNTANITALSDQGVQFSRKKTVKELIEEID